MLEMHLDKVTQSLEAHEICMHIIHCETLCICDKSAVLTCWELVYQKRHQTFVTEDLNQLQEKKNVSIFTFSSSLLLFLMQSWFFSLFFFFLHILLLLLVHVSTLHG